MSSRDEWQAVRVVTLAVHDQMRVIGHEAVRHDCETLFTRGAEKLLNDQIDGRVFLQQPRPILGCEFEGIGELSDVREIWQMLRIEMWHATV